MGWSTSLAITRAPLVGDVDYTSGEFMSPWGRLAAGTDGYFLSAGVYRLAYAFSRPPPDGSQSRPMALGVRSPKL